MKRRDRYASLCLLLGVAMLGAPPQGEAQQYLNPPRPYGDPIAPYLDGWYTETDGTYGFSFGYFNFNTEEVVEIPLGPDNFITPEEYDGMQPTIFDVSPRRERGTFAVNVPGDFAESGGQLLWTLIRGEDTLSVPAYIGVPALEITHGPAAMGTEEPVLRFEEEGPESRGQYGLVDPEVRRVSVGEPLELTAWVSDPSNRRPRNPSAPQEGELDVSLDLTWFKHQGALEGEVTFERDPDAVQEQEAEADADPDGDDEEEEELPPNVVELPPGGGAGTVIARFDTPGEYMLRVRADSFRHTNDSGASNQCCWTNGYLRVEVTP